MDVLQYTIFYKYLTPKYIFYNLSKTAAIACALFFLDIRAILIVVSANNRHKAG